MAPGYLSQRPSLLEGSLIENLDLGVQDAKVGMGRLEACLEDGHLEKLLAPNGLW